MHNQRMPLSVILSEVSNAHEAEGSRTGSRKRTRYRFPVREALASYAKVSFRKGGEGDRSRRTSPWVRLPSQGRGWELGYSRCHRERLTSRRPRGYEFARARSEESIG